MSDHGLRRCLTIGSSDSGGGAGIQGDVKTFCAMGCYASTVLVGVTAQNTRGVLDRSDVPPAMVAAQLDAVLDDIGADAIKIGATWSVAVVQTLAAHLTAFDIPLVVDPVMTTAGGDDIVPWEATLEALRSLLLPLATVVTPNRVEARRLAGLPNCDDPRELAEAIVELGAVAVIVTGGASPRDGDWFFDGREHRRIGGGATPSSAVHGSGCAHSAMICALLATGYPLDRAAVLAHDHTARAIERGHRGIGSGMHPVDVLDLSERGVRLEHS